jgi:predicted DNA-binding protein YlxM (UPF0122 family)
MKKMISDQNEAVLEDIKSILQLKRPLLPIEKYAVREGVTRRVVEEYGRLGIIQIRKYKGKTYVVDVPLSPYLLESGELQALQESFQMASQADSTLRPRSGQASSPRADEKRHQQVNRAGQVKMISELIPPTPASAGLSQGRRENAVQSRPAQKVVAGSNKIAAKPLKPNIETSKGQTSSGLTKDLFNKAYKISNKIAGKNKIEIGHRDRLSTSASVSQTGMRQLDNDIEQDETRRKWQIAAVSFMVCFFVAFLGCLLLFMNQRVHSGKIDQANASIQSVYDDFIRTNQQLATLQGKLVEFTAEIEWVKNELNNSKTESESVRNDLTQIKRSLDTIQQYNNAALGQFREQLQQITTRLGKIIKNPETSSDINTLGQ